MQSPLCLSSETQHVLFGLAVIRTLRFDEGTNIATFQTWERYVCIQKHCDQASMNMTNFSSELLLTTTVFLLMPSVSLYNVTAR